ncbi:MAG: putative Fe-S cluster assembly protein SufT [Verrucomicrobiales bacterium]
MHQEIELTREVEAIQIPSGDDLVLPQGMRVIITQALGGTYTVATEQGLARISSANADALGIDLEAEKKKKLAAAPKTPEAMEKAVWEQLKNVFDPEIPVNIVDLGLVYDCVIQGEKGKEKTVDIKMTLTAPGCGMGPTIAADAQSRVMTIPGISEARVDLVWDPPWTQDMISEEGKMKLGMI